MQGKEVRKIYVDWGQREESAEACAVRLRDYWDRLAAQFPKIEHWFDTGRTRKSAWTTPCISGLSDQGLVDFIKTGVNRRDDNKEPIPDLGFVVSIWNQRRQPCEMAMMVHCGCWSKWINIPNSVSLSFPDAPEEMGIMGDEDVLKLLDIGRQSWDAEIGRVYALRESEPMHIVRF